MAERLSLVGELLKVPMVPVLKDSDLPAICYKIEL